MSYKYKIYILSIVLLVSISAFYFLSLKKSFVMLNNKAKEIADKRSELLSIGLKKMTKDVLINNLKDTEADRVVLDNFFVQDNNIVQFLKILEKTINTYGIKYYEINPLLKDKNNRFAFSVNLYGSFPNFLKFLTAVENLDYFLKIKSINIIKIGKNINSQKLPLLSEDDINAVIIIETGI